MRRATCHDRFTHGRCTSASFPTICSHKCSWQQCPAIHRTARRPTFRSILHFAALMRRPDVVDAAGRLRDRTAVDTQSFEMKLIALRMACSVSSTVAPLPHIPGTSGLGGELPPASSITIVHRTRSSFETRFFQDTAQVPGAKWSRLSPTVTRPAFVGCLSCRHFPSSQPVLDAL